MAVLLAAVLAGCGGNGDDGDDGRRADARSGGHAQLAGAPLFGGSLEPNRRYRTRAFDPAFSLVVQDGDWLARETQSRTLVVLDGALGREADERPRPMFLAFQRYRRVYDPDTPGEGAASTIPAPRDFTAWLARHPDLDVEQTSPTRVARLAGHRLDAVLTTGKPRHPHGLPECPVDCVALAPDAWFGQGLKVRFIVLGSARRPLVITIEAFPRDSASFTARAQRVLKSVRFNQAP